MMINEFWQVCLGGSVAACLPQPAFLAFRLGRISMFGKNNKIAKDDNSK